MNIYLHDKRYFQGRFRNPLDKKTIRKTISELIRWSIIYAYLWRIVSIYKS